jgi:hypothetical protein
MPKCKPSDKYPLDLWKCNKETGRYVKKVKAGDEKKKAAEKFRVDRIKEQIAAVRREAAATCEAAKKKASKKIESLKEKLTVKKVVVKKVVKKVVKVEKVMNKRLFPFADASL